MRNQHVMMEIIMIECVFPCRQAVFEHAIVYAVHVAAGIYFRIIIVGCERPRFYVILPFPFQVLCPGNGRYIGER